MSDLSELEKAPLDPAYIEMFSHELDKQMDYLEKVIYRGNTAYILGDLNGARAMANKAIELASEMTGIHAIVGILDGVMERDK